MAAKQINPRLIWTVSILLALIFLAIGVVMVLKPEQTGSQPANAAQTPPLVLKALGVALCLGAVLLLVPRVAWVGAVLLGLILIGVIGLWVFQGDGMQTLIPALLLISVGTLAYIRRPGRPSATPPRPEGAAVNPAATTPLTNDPSRD